ncbi:MAG TPA: hypothetical protein VFR26_03135 [Acidimicrobiales bacterium]|nr:hypothetical protein [Acidimicrobiales bacterium]
MVDVGTTELQRLEPAVLVPRQSDRAALVSRHERLDHIDRGGEQASRTQRHDQRPDITLLPRLGRGTSIDVDAIAPQVADEARHLRQPTVVETIESFTAGLDLEVHPPYPSPVADQMIAPTTVPVHELTM